jgi:hypothetical protein
MRGGRLNRKTWLNLREAANRIGRELLGDDWSDRMLDRKTHDRTLADIDHDLYLVMSSGDVTVLLDHGDDPHVMKPSETQRLRFDFDVANNWVQIRDDERWQCSINTSELESFLLKHRQDRFLQRSESERVEDCRLWLSRLMKGQRRPKGTIKSEAKKNSL